MRERTLPHRPRLRAGLAVLARRAGELQIGLDPRRALVISGLPEPVLAAATDLTGGRTTDEVVAGVGPPHEEVLLDLLADLVDHGLLDDDAVPGPRVPLRLAGDAATATLHPGLPPPAERADYRVLVRGDGRLAVAVAGLLAVAGVGRLHVAARGTVRAEDVGTGYLVEDIGRPRQVAGPEAVRRAEETAGVRRFARFRPDLVVLTDALVPEPSTVVDLVTDGQAHLAVRVRDGVGIVGPLVVPGASGCLHCADHHRTDLDPCWPRIAAQLAGRALPTDLATAHVTAGLAVTQVLHAVAWLRDPTAQPPRTWNTTLEVNPFTAAVDHRRWQPHPDCRCGAATHPTYRHLLRHSRPAGAKRA
ncbi:TOMM precursor leader peptide-binding protein [Actinokineospora diospyrosa]|uniref:Bacteriocin biosynthesis cyclodehydratase domain-containing protein n=1 Tax=Actinokineospora diospyrosa TaxID=103728 RepID=A0ABT1I9Y0_9PSEU|nr:TOMM precursor leader peptide-binding protein [Actinokineospora diospyrosa]MCP2269450.1 bacteriocin biosynthesis cyclodehydratase domain-containing protein [Actinokineospora diospyrosa]